MDSLWKKKEFARKKLRIRHRNGRDGRGMAVHVCLCENESIFNILFVRARVMVWCQEMSFHCLSLIFTDKVLSSIIIISWAEQCGSRNVCMSEFMCAALRLLLPLNTFSLLVAVLLLLLSLVLSQLMWWTRQLWKRKVIANFSVFSSSPPLSSNTTQCCARVKSENKVCKKVTLKWKKIIISWVSRWSEHNKMACASKTFANGWNWGAERPNNRDGKLKLPLQMRKERKKKNIAAIELMLFGSFVYNFFADLFSSFFL